MFTTSPLSSLLPHMCGWVTGAYPPCVFPPIGLLGIVCVYTYFPIFILNIAVSVVQSIVTIVEQLVHIYVCGCLCVYVHCSLRVKS